MIRTSVNGALQERTARFQRATLALRGSTSQLVVKRNVLGALWVKRQRAIANLVTIVLRDNIPMKSEVLAKLVRKPDSLVKTGLNLDAHQENLLEAEFTLAPIVRLDNIRQGPWLPVALCAKREPIAKTVASQRLVQNASQDGISILRARRHLVLASVAPLYHRG